MPPPPCFSACPAPLASLRNGTHLFDRAFRSAAHFRVVVAPKGFEHCHFRGGAGPAERLGGGGSDFRAVVVEVGSDRLGGAGISYLSESNQGLAPAGRYRIFEVFDKRRDSALGSGPVEQLGGKRAFRCAAGEERPQSLHRGFIQPGLLERLEQLERSRLL